MTFRSAAWVSQAIGFVEAETPAVLVTVVAIEGSAPRDAGARMIVTDTALVGTVGGGNLEYQLTEQARRLLPRDGISILQQDYPLGPLLAQCCGGRVRVLLERLEPASLQWLKPLSAFLEARRACTLAGHVAGGHMRWSVKPPGDRTPERAIEILDAASRPAGMRSPWAAIIEHFDAARPQLLLFGAGHVGKAVARIVRTLPFDLKWIDSRTDMVGDAGQAAPECADPVATVQLADACAFYLIMTHSHDLDFAIARSVLLRGDAEFCGLIGSATKRTRFVSRLEKEGVSASGLVCPIGFGGIRGKEPESIAISVAADLLVRLEASVARISERTVAGDAA